MAETPKEKIETVESLREVVSQLEKKIKSLESLVGGNLSKAEEKLRQSDDKLKRLGPTDPDYLGPVKKGKEIEAREKLRFVPDAPDNVDDFIGESDQLVGSGKMGEGELYSVLARVTELGSFRLSDEQKDKLADLKKKALEELEKTAPRAKEDKPAEFEDFLKEKTGRDDSLLDDKNPGESKQSGQEDELGSVSEKTASQGREDIAGMSDAGVRQMMSSLIDDDNRDTNRNTPEAEDRRARILELMEERDRRERGETVEGSQTTTPESDQGASEKGATPEVREEVPPVPQEVHDAFGYSEVESARQVYIEKLAMRRRWIFGRGSKEELEESRKNYEEAQKTYYARMIAELTKEGRTSEQIAEIASNAQIDEITIRSRQEVELAEGGKWRKAKNWLKQHPMARMIIGVSLTVGVFIPPISIPAVIAKAAFSGVSTAVAVEGGAEWTGLMNKIRGMKNLSAEDIQKEREQLLSKKKLREWEYIRDPQKAQAEVDAVLASSLNESLAKKLAYSISMGKSVEEDETVKNILEEKRRILLDSLTRELQAGKTPTQLQAGMLNDAISEDVGALEQGQNDERSLSMKKWAAAGALGAVMGTVVGSRGMHALQARSAYAGHQPTGQAVTEHAQPPTGQSSAQAAVEQAQQIPKPTHEQIVTGFSQQLTADGQMDSEWKMIETAMKNYQGHLSNYGESLNLNPRQMEIATDRLKDLWEAGPLNPNAGGYGWIDKGYTQVFTGRELQEAANYALTHPNG